MSPNSGGGHQGAQPARSTCKGRGVSRAFSEAHDKQSCISSLFRVENRPGFVAVELRLRNYYYDVVN